MGLYLRGDGVAAKSKLAIQTLGPIAGGYLPVVSSVLNLFRISQPKQSYNPAMAGRG
jgi:hypothetical protein